MYDLLFQYFEDKTEMDWETFAQFSHYFQPKKVKRNEYLLMTGDVCAFNYFVNSGCLRFYSMNDEAQELTRYFAFEGKFGTALASFIEQKPSFEYVQAIEKSELLIISRQDFLHLVHTVPQVNLVYRDLLEMAYVTSQERIYGFQGQSALERLKWLMNYQPNILSRLSNKVIASYLGGDTLYLEQIEG